MNAGEPGVIQCQAPGVCSGHVAGVLLVTWFATVRLMPNAHGLCAARIMHAAFDISARATAASSAGQGKPSPV